MKQDKNQKRIRLFYLSLILFFIVFICRVFYGLYFDKNDILISYNSEGSYSSEHKITNVATDRISKVDNSGQKIVLDQKYEKTANLSSNTLDFENDNQNLRSIIKENNAVIQMERLSGLKGSQKLSIVIGVSPNSFDKILDDISKIGSITSFNVNKVDKTDEFRKITAEIETLNKTKMSYLAIKEKGGAVKDLLIIEEKILEIEKNLQNLGVNLGLYSTENSFCTVNLDLNEQTKKQISASFIIRTIGNSFTWTILTFVSIMFAFTIIFAFIAVWVEISFHIKKRKDSAEVSE